MDYRSIIESKYNRESWQALLHDIFKSGANFRANPVPVAANSPLAVSSYQLGAITLADDSKIAVYEIKLSDSVDIVVNRVGIRNLLISDWKVKGCTGAFMFCYRDNESVLRFSYVSSSFKFTDDGKIEKEETDTKRFTYLLGEGHRSRTAIKQFEELKNSKLTLKDITKAFSIEALSDRFFNEYKAIYEDIVEYITGKRMVKISNKWEEVVIHSPNATVMNEFKWSDDPEKAVRDYVKKLMGRIVFLQFIQKKGWLGVPMGKDWGSGDKEYLQSLYDNSSSKDNFIDEVLETLFIDINTKRENDAASQILGKNIKVPYLNGGLFEQDRSDRSKFILPRKYMDSMLKFFSSYNFTIDENAPDDAEIGVDPEMLGRIFENLLEDNKDKGAFYTPKEIVQYMCRESLIAYLQNGIDDSEKELIRSFVSSHRMDSLTDALIDKVDERLKNVKICDPAIGSGAFPMGLLKELFECRSAIEGLSDDNAAEIKKHIIQNNIYGVDIEKGAVDIARLRFWLSIIVDEKTPHALPNMDFKILQGNSLIPTFSGKYVNLDDNLSHINSNKIRAAKKELSRLQNEFYSAEGVDKQRLLIEIKYQILEIVKLQMDYEIQEEIERSAETIDIFNQTTQQVVIDEEKRKIVGQCVSLQNQLKNESKSLTERTEISIPFFDWKIMFSDIFLTENDKGFDIVIGNPPYIQLQAESGKLGELYKNRKFESFIKTGDIYCLFYEQGYNLLREHGSLCFITSNKWMRAGYGEKLRGFFATKTNPKLLIDFAGVKIFENATVDTNILLFAKEENHGETVSYEVDKTDEYCIAKLGDYVRQNSSALSYSTNDSWVILTRIEQSIKNKIESIGTPLSKWDININYGIKTGFNEAFIITSDKREDILNACSSEKERELTNEIIRPILRGRDIKRYGYLYAGLYLIATFPSRHYDIDDYPALKSFLLSFGIERLEQTGDEYLIDGEKVKSRKKTSNKWFETQDSISYWEDLFQPKIIWGEISDKSKFCFDKEGQYFPEATTFLMTGKELPWLICFLNAKLSEYMFSKIGTTTGVGTIRWKKFKIEQLYVPMKVAPYEKQPILDAGEEIMRMKAKGEDSSCKEKALDNLIYNLFKLTKEEIAFIERTV